MTSPSNNKSMPLLLLLSVCISVIVILNMSYLPQLVSSTVKYTRYVDESVFSFQSTPLSARRRSIRNVQKPNGRSDHVKVEQAMKEWKDVKSSKGKQQQPLQQDTDTDRLPDNHKIAGLNCDRFGGPSEEIAAEMVYWRDIPDDALYESPYKRYGQSEKYLTFEPDEGGWNNIRMSMETATTLAHAMGRTLVLPPEQNMYLLNKDQGKNNRFTFKKFFYFDSIAREHPAVDVITMDEFLEREVMQGKILDSFGNPSFPPGNKTIWEGHVRDSAAFWHWWRNVTKAPLWDFSSCVVGIASQPGPKGQVEMLSIAKTIPADNRDTIKEFVNNPTNVDADPADRLREMLGTRRDMCIYNDKQQKSKVMHFMGDNASGARLLVHFYAYLFFEDWRADVWTKRYVRDHLRYIDEIQCAAATIVHAVRQKAKENGDPDGIFDTFHIRRGDFQYKQTRIEATEIYENIKDVLVENSTVFIATDERQKDFFLPLKDHYNIYFLDDFLHLVPNLNKNYYGMLDQRIASRGRTFIGAYFSTFTGYINRMRGYHSQKDKAPGWDKGTINSYYYVERQHKHELVNYHSIKPPMWGREFPVAWRDIDHNVEPHQFISR